jgi:hypothetical protein
MPAGEFMARQRVRVRNHWQAISVLIAVATLIGALVFNGIQVSASADAQRQAKLATELGLLTQLQTVMTQSVYKRVQYANQFRQLRAGRRATLSPDAYRRTAEEGATMDYVAWLFDKGYVASGQADQLWGPRMLCEYRQAFAPGLRDPAHDLSDLVEFIQERGRRLSRLVERC